jgi:hypothetical protein
MAAIPSFASVSSRGRRAGSERSITLGCRRRVVVSFAPPVLAADTFYVMFDKTAKKCSVSKSAPTETEKY